MATSSSLILQALKVGLGQWPSFTGMEHGDLHARAVYERLGDVSTGSLAESMSPR